MTTGSTDRGAPRLADVAEQQRLPEHDLLSSLIGRWITVGETIPTDGAWTWNGPHARAQGVLSDDGQTMPTLHKWPDDGVTWRPSMDVTLRKVV